MEKLPGVVAISSSLLPGHSPCIENMQDNTDPVGEKKRNLLPGVERKMDADHRNQRSSIHWVPRE